MGASCEPLGFDRLELYPGPDVENAFQRSEVVLSRPARASTQREEGGPLRTLLHDARGMPELNLLPVTRVIEGIESRSGASLRVLFQGQLRSLDFCARHIFGSDAYEVGGAERVPASSFDVRVTDHPLLDRGLPGTRPALRVAPWLRQRCPLGADWRQTLARLPRSLRKELGRLLRRHDFGVSVGTGAALRQNFYTRVYVPYVRERFGRSAILPAERAFMRESEGAALLMLNIDGELSGGCLLRRTGATLAIDKSALNLAQDVADRSELLDYYCLLLAQKLGCRALDFGVSRPHLDDGVFRYKAKWRPELVPAGGLKRTIRIRPLNLAAAARGFLSRNGFIERRAGRFVVRRLCERGASSTLGAELEALAERAGLDAFVCMTRDGGGSATGAGPTRVEWRPLAPAGDPLREFLRCV